MVMPSCAVQPPPTQALDPTSMECLRGPCKHYWTLAHRYDAQGERFFMKRSVQCNCHVEAMDLEEQNIYRCGQWWPGWLDWIPDSLRYVMRPRLRQLWEYILKRQGWDFSWRIWAEDDLEAPGPRAPEVEAPPEAAPRQTVRAETTETSAASAEALDADDFWYAGLEAKRRRSGASLSTSAPAPGAEKEKPHE